MIMKEIKYLVAAGFLAAFSTAALAQDQVVTVTNVVTVLVTNVITVTNVVTSAPAQTPTPAATPAPAAPVKHSWNSSVSAGLTLVRGNTDTTLFSADFLTEKKQPTDEYSLGAGLAYGTQNGLDTANMYKAFGQWNHLFSDRFYSYVRADGLRDLISDVDYRFNLGPGAGYYLVKNTNTFLATEVGAGYENEHLGGAYDSFATVRFAERFEHKFSDRARLWQTVEVLPQVDKFDNYLVNFEIGMEAAVSKSVSLKVCLDDNYANRPAADRLKNDAKIVAGVSYKF